MVNLKLIFASCLLFGFLGLTQYPGKTKAADPNACPQYACKNVAFWWTGDAKTINAAFDPGTTNPTTQGWVKVFATQSSYDAPTAKTGNTYDLNTFIACTPTCGKDKNGVWQAWQEVAPSGASTVNTKGETQYTCKYLGKTGPTVANPVNINGILKNTLPGYVSE